MLARVTWGWEIEVHVDAPIDEIAGRLPPTLAELAAERAGTRLHMRADSLDWTAGVLGGLGADFRVVRPDELRDVLGRLASRLELSSRRAS